MNGLSNDDTAAIDALRDHLVRAILAGDVNAYVRSYAMDGIVMHPETPLVRGDAALREYATALFRAVRVSTLVLTPLQVVGDGGVAFEVGVQDCAIQPSNEHFKRKRQYLHAYRRQPDGTWKIAAAMSGNQ